VSLSRCAGLSRLKMRLEELEHPLEHVVVDDLGKIQTVRPAFEPLVSVRDTGLLRRTRAPASGGRGRSSRRHTTARNAGGGCRGRRASRSLPWSAVFAHQGRSLCQSALAESLEQVGGHFPRNSLSGRRPRPPGTPIRRGQLAFRQAQGLDGSGPFLRAPCPAAEGLEQEKGALSRWLSAPERVEMAPAAGLPLPLVVAATHPLCGIGQPLLRLCLRGRTSAWLSSSRLCHSDKKKAHAQRSMRCCLNGSGGWIRTSDQVVNSHLLYR
jgi:hypothetical protein